MNNTVLLLPPNLCFLTFSEGWLHPPIHAFWSYALLLFYLLNFIMIGFFWWRRIRQLKYLNQLKKDKWENEIKRKIEKIFQLTLQWVRFMGSWDMQRSKQFQRIYTLWWKEYSKDMFSRILEIKNQLRIFCLWSKIEGTYKVYAF